MLEVKNVQKSFGSNQVLKGVDLKVEKGDFIDASKSISSSGLS